MELTKVTTAATPSRTTGEATGTATLSAGDSLKAELGNDVELDTECPAGKAWFVTVRVHVVETDA